MTPADPTKRLRARQRMILARLRRWGYLAESEVLTEKKPETPPVTDTALQQTPPTDTASPEPTATTGTTATETTDTVTTTGTTDTSTTVTTTTPPPVEN
jgi:hypothetical protein